MKKLITLLALSLVSMAGFSQVYLNKAQFLEKVWDFEKTTTLELKSDKPVILDFYADWCKPCKMITPELKVIEKKYKDKIIVYKIDVDKDIEIAKIFKIQAMPTLYFINTNNEATYVVGYRTSDELDQVVKGFFYK